MITITDRLPIRESLLFWVWVGWVLDCGALEEEDERFLALPLSRVVFSAWRRRGGMRLGKFHSQSRPVFFLFVFSASSSLLLFQIGGPR